VARAPSRVAAELERRSCGQRTGSSTTTGISRSVLCW
jgi:hypothetical protein